MEPPKTIQELSKFFRKLPSVGTRTSQRLAYACLGLPKQDLETFVSTLSEALEKIHQCPQCGILIDTAQCPICSDTKRNPQKLMVVTSSRDVLAVENAECYDGLYFVLSGTLSPAEHRTPTSIGLDRLEKAVDENRVEEVIVCTGNDLEGETTGLYIDSLLSKKGVCVTKPASGLPSGAVLEYADPSTIFKAVAGRVAVKKGGD